MKFENLKLATKQGIAFGFILFIMAGTTVFSLVEMSRLKDEIDKVNANWLPSVISIAEINLNTSEYRISELQHAFTHYGHKMQEQEQIMLAIKAMVDKKQDIYEPLMVYPEERKLYSDFREKWKRYLELHEQFMRLSRQNNA